jgi:hypothetical protein
MRAMLPWVHPPARFSTTTHVSASVSISTVRVSPKQNQRRQSACARSARRVATGSGWSIVLSSAEIRASLIAKASPSGLVWSWTWNFTFQPPEWASIGTPCVRQWSPSPRPILCCLTPHAKSVGSQHHQRCHDSAPDQVAAAKRPTTEDAGLGLAKADEYHAATTIGWDLGRFDGHRDVLTGRGILLQTG